MTRESFFLNELDLYENYLNTFFIKKSHRPICQLLPIEEKLTQQK
jgi:hypothetical protein